MMETMIIDIFDNLKSRGSWDRNNFEIDKSDVLFLIMF